MRPGFAIGGESQLDTLEAWYDSDEGINAIEQLSDKVGPAPIDVSVTSGSFIPQKVSDKKDTFTIRLGS